MNKINNFLQKLRYGYRFMAMTLLNTLVAFLLLNAILSVEFAIKDYFSSNSVSTKYGHEAIKAVYQELSEPEIDALLQETWSRPVIYEPFTQFQERPYRGHYVNVDRNGFRFSKNQGPWPPQSANLNVFLFGGSTTFGYGVPDHQTIASYLQEHLSTRLNRNVHVYNFGRGHYYSTQERILYEKLLTSGFVPDMAIFIDGLNDFSYRSDEPRFTFRLRDFVASGAGDGFIARTSLGRAAKELNHWFSKNVIKKSSTNEKTTPHVYNNPKVINQVIERYLSNKKLIEAVSKSFAVKSIFVWQPIPTYHYDQQYHPFSQGGYGQHSYSRFGYQHMAELIEENPLGKTFLWCADIQENEKKPLYIDKLHYSANFSNQFAKNIADLLNERHLSVAHSQYAEQFVTLNLD